MKTKYQAHLHLELADPSQIIAALLPDHAQPLHYRLHHTKREYDAPTKAGVKYTNLEYFLTTADRYESSSLEQI